MEGLEGFLDKIAEEMLWIAFRQGIDGDEGVFQVYPPLFHGQEIEFMTGFVITAFQGEIAVILQYFRQIRTIPGNNLELDPIFLLKKELGTRCLGEAHRLDSA